MKSALRIYQYVNILSLDVALGAVICASFFANLFQVKLLPQGLTSLGLAVWIIYTIDHLLDAKRLDQTASTVRHRFHQQYFKTLFLLVIIASLTELVLIFFLRKPVFYGGLWLSAGVVVYVLVNRFLKYFKEVAGALLYCSGVLLPVFSLRQESFLYYDKIMIAQFMLIALINLILFSWMDYEKDLQDKHRSLVTHLSKTVVTRILVSLFVFFAALSFLTIYVYPKETIIFICMTLILLIIFSFPDYFKEERFRLLGDAVFFLPLIGLIN